MSCWHTVKNILILNLYGTYFRIVFCLQNEESIFLKPFIKVPIFPHCFKRDLCIYRNLVYLEFLGQCPSVSVVVTFRFKFRVRFRVVIRVRVRIGLGLWLGLE